MSVELLTLAMFGGFFLLLAAGVPVMFSLTSVSIAAGFTISGADFPSFVLLRVLNVLGTYSFIGIPLFVFMANVLRYSGIAENLFKVLYIWMGPVRGGLGIATIITSMMLAAMVGTAGAGEVIMGLVALPAMLNRKYNSDMALGSILAGGTLGILIPPSVVFIIYGVFAQESIGKLFIGGVVPGLILGGLYSVYILLRCWVRPYDGPALSAEERAAISLRDKLRLTRALILPSLLIVGVLGSIFAGMATTTEAAAVGALGAVVCSLIKRSFTWKNLHQAVVATIHTVGMVMWVVFAASLFVGVYTLAGGSAFVKDVALSLNLGRWGMLLLMMVILILLGMVLDPNGIIILCVPIMLPIIKALHFDPFWFAILFNVNIQIAFISPPFGYSLFYLKSVAPPQISLFDTYRAALPFILLQFVGLAICMSFPPLVTWLPNLLTAP